MKILEREISKNSPTYFIADIGANHDGDLNRAKDLIYLAAEAGADAAKFQHFSAETIVSDYGFKSLGGNLSHQSKWKKSVFNVYKDASLDTSWTPALKETCDKAGIDFFSSPYSFELVDHIDPYVPVYKIGSGDITWIEIIEYIARKNKPYILATGAASLTDVKRAVNSGLKYNANLAIMQCNTNYTGNIENLKYINLNVLNQYSEHFPNLILGLSDHTPGHSTVLGAIALGSRLIEKHFTDDVSRNGPDHGFAMDPLTWKEMVERSRELELSLGKGDKKVENNETETVILQRRSIRASCNISKEKTITNNDLICLRPCPEDGLPPYEINKIIGRKVSRQIKEGDIIRWKDVI